MRLPKKADIRKVFDKAKYMAFRLLRNKTYQKNIVKYLTGESFDTD